MQRADLFDRPGLVGTRRWETPARARYLLSPSAIHAKLKKPMNIESIFSKREKMRRPSFMPLNRRSFSLHLLFLHMARLHSGSDPTRPHPIPTPTPAYTRPPLPRIRPSGADGGATAMKSGSSATRRGLRPSQPRSMSRRSARSASPGLCCDLLPLGASHSSRAGARASLPRELPHPATWLDDVERWKLTQADVAALCRQAALNQGELVSGASHACPGGARR